MGGVQYGGARIDLHTDVKREEADYSTRLVVL
jgi:hypothetical protein